jgi:hypothetical protein
MRNSIRYATAAPAVLGLLLASASLMQSRVEARPDAVAATVAEEPAPQKCCFTNPRLTGKCEVTLAKGETCAAVLDYLNNPNSQGKSYCENTTVRGGWQSASCAATK